jgi:acyl carrier protein
MTTTPTTLTETPPTMPELAMAIVAVLAEIRQVPVAELEAERGDGDLSMDSPEAVAVIATLQGRFGRRLAQVEDLEPEQLTSVASLADLLHRRWSSVPLTSEANT